MGAQSDGFDVRCPGCEDDLLIGKLRADCGWCKRLILLEPRRDKEERIAREKAWLSHFQGEENEPCWACNLHASIAKAKEQET